MDEDLERLKLQNIRQKQVFLKVCREKLPPEQAIPLLFIAGLRGFSLILWEKIPWLDNLEEAQKMQNCFYALHRTQNHLLEQWELLELFEDSFYPFKRYKYDNNQE